MRRRVLAEFGDRSDLDADEIAVQTYHAFAASIVHEHALLLGLEQSTTLLDQAQKWQLMREALEQCSFDQLEISWLPTFISRLLNLHDEIQRHDLALSAVADACRQRPADDVFAKRLEAVAALEHYAELKLLRNAIDFGDQIMLANQVLRQRADVLDRLRQRFRYVFLDEYQDTDVAQRARAADRNGRGSRLCGGRRRSGDLRLAWGDDSTTCSPSRRTSRAPSPTLSR